MKKKDFVTTLMSVVGGLLFSLGMGMALVPKMGTITQGVVVGVVGGYKKSEDGVVDGFNKRADMFVDKSS